MKAIRFVHVNALRLRLWAISALIGFSCLVSATKAADERLWLDAKINGTPARLCLDTGFELIALTPNAAKRFGLKATTAPMNEQVAPGRIRCGITEQCLLNLEGTDLKTKFAVIDFPAPLTPDFDGLIGWWAVKSNRVRIDAFAGMVTFPDELEEQLAGWTRLTLATNSDTLILEISHTNGGCGIICVDTGNDMGVLLPHRKWEAWKKAHPHFPVALQGCFRPADGFVVLEESWATKISLGPLVITDVPMAEAPLSDVTNGGRYYEGTLGLAALRRLDLIVDGIRGVAHLRTKTTPPRPYEHNRAGVAFLPSHSRSDVLIAARVLERSPAWEAGVRNGDTLIKCDGKTISLHQGNVLFQEAPGTTVELTLKRGRKTFTTTVTLRQILPPAPQ